MRRSSGSRESFRAGSQSECSRAPDRWLLADSSTHDAGQVLVQAAKRGDNDAFEVLVRQHAAVVYRQVRGSSGVLVDDADDIAQEVFVRAYRFLGTFRGESSFRSWLYRLTINVTRTYQRRRSRHWRFWADSGECTEACVIDNHSDAFDLEQAYLRRELIEKALNTLPPGLRESVVLRDMHGFEYQEIADAMGVPLGTVESRIFRARRRLRPLLAELRGRTVAQEPGEPVR